MMALVLSFVLAWLLCLLLLSRFTPLHILDAPNERSLHEVPTPRTGGVAMIVAIAAAWGLLVYLYAWPQAMGWIAVAAVMVAGISLVDDFRELSALQRIAIHAVAAAVLVAGGMVLFGGWVGMFLSWIAIVWMLNLYNFMDGMDGFASGMAVFGFSFLALAGWLAGNEVYALYCLVVMAATLGFLMVNFPPARMFMGDAGSASLGVLVAGFSLWGIQEHLFAWWFAVLVFSPFMVDATVTLLRRMVNRERVWEAHRSHYYQRLVQMGWGHKKTVLFEYMVMLFSGVSALCAWYAQDDLITLFILLLWMFFYWRVAAFVHRCEARQVM